MKHQVKQTVNTEIKKITMRYEASSKSDSVNLEKSEWVKWKTLETAVQLCGVYGLLSAKYNIQ